MAENDERLVLAFRGGIRAVFDGLPFEALAHHQHLDVVALQHVTFRWESRISWVEREFGHAHGRVAHDP